ncbi:MAG: hypothetical protein ABSH15_15985, partial [Verrucomicrobiota bacterium]
MKTPSKNNLVLVTHHGHALPDCWRNWLPRKVAQFYQKVYDFLPSKFVIYNTACFWRFSASYPLKKLVS